MIKQLLFQRQSKTQLVIAMSAAFLGFTFLLISVHYILHINNFGSESEILGANTIIVQKKVSNFNTMALSKTDFSNAELKNIEEQDFTDKIAPIYNNNFDVSLQTNSELVPYFRSDVFVQSIAPEFIDLDLSTWNWQPKDAFVPIILPREFLVMLNTFASAKGIPQVSDDLAKSIGFKFTLSNQEKKEWHDAKIIGFTSEVSSILVPNEFLDYGNEHFPIGKPEKITQVLVTVSEGKFGEFESWMNERNLESKKSALLLGKVKSIASTFFSIVIAVSILVIFLAGLALIQYAQIILYRNTYELTTLLRIGYNPRQLLQSFGQYFLVISLWITVLSTIAFLVLKLWIDQLLHKSGITISTEYTVLSFLSILVVIICYYLANTLSAKKHLGLLK